MTSGRRPEVWPPPSGLVPDLLPAHKAAAHRLRQDAKRVAVLRLWAGMLALVRTLYAVAPLAFGRRRCSSSRGINSTKLHGR